MFSGIDVFHFKGAGCNLAAGYGLTSNSYVGTESFDRELWLSQGPIFPLLFGGFASLFGCSVGANDAFDLIVSVMLAGEVLFLFPASASKFEAVCFSLLLAVLLPTGAYEWPTDRPDHLALVFILVILILDKPAHPHARPQWNFLLAGLTFLISPFYGIVAGAMGVALLLGRADIKQRPTYTKILAECVLLSALPIMVTVTCYLVIDPGSVHRFLRHTRIVFTDSTLLGGLDHAIWSSGLTSVLLMARGLAGLCLAVFALLCLSRKVATRDAVFLIGFIALLLVSTIFVFPRQNNYFSALAFLVGVSTLWCIARKVTLPARRGVLLLASSSVLFLPLMPGLLFEVTRSVETHKSYARERQWLQAIGPTLADPSNRLVVLVPPSHYFLVREFVPNIFNPDYLFKGYDRQRIKASMVCDSGRIASGDLVQGNASMDPELSLRQSGIRPVVLRVLGHRIAGRYWDWGCVVERHTPGRVADNARAALEARR